jgi:hypothetical protein
MTETTESEKTSSPSLADKLPLGGLKDAAGNLGKSLVNSALGKVSDRVEGLSGQLDDYTEGKPRSVKSETAVDGRDSPISSSGSRSASRLRLPTTSGRNSSSGPTS